MRPRSCLAMSAYAEAEMSPPEQFHQKMRFLMTLKPPQNEAAQNNELKQFSKAYLRSVAFGAVFHGDIICDAREDLESRRE